MQTTFTTSNLCPIYLEYLKSITSFKSYFSLMRVVCNQISFWTSLIVLKSFDKGLVVNQRVN